MKSNKNFKRTFATIALTALLTATVFSLAGCFPSEKRGESIDDFWYATVEKDGNEKYVRIWGLTQSGVRLSKTQTEATIPETIGGYPVKHLKAAWFTNIGMYKDVRAADLGSLKRLTIEPCVRIGENFFGDNELDVIELKSEEPFVRESNAFGGRNANWAICIIPDNANKKYTDYYNTFKKSEIMNDCLIKGKVFYGYIGTDSEIAIPEGVINIVSYKEEYSSGSWSFYNYIKYPITSVRFPTTLNKIQKDNIFNCSYNDKKYDTLEKVYVSENTIVEDGAFTPEIEIIRY